MLTAIDKLTDLIERLQTANNLTALNQEAKEFLRTLNIGDRILTAQKLVEAGFAPEDLRHSCFTHMGGLFGNVAPQLKENLPSGHVIRTMIEEHDCILGFLDTLETLNQTIQHQGCITAFELETIDAIARYLLAAEPHHQREEQVLFPEVEQHGLIGPPEVMRHEHEELRAWKHSLLELGQSGYQILGNKIEVQKFKSKLTAIAGFLTLALREHIIKENNILFPAALQAIQDAEIWERMRIECDRIGYCCFTPNHQADWEEEL